VLEAAWQRVECGEVAVRWQRVECGELWAGAEAGRHGTHGGSGVEHAQAFSGSPHFRRVSTATIDHPTPPRKGLAQRLAGAARSPLKKTQ